MDGLGSARTSAARQLIELSSRITPPLGVGGVPTADRVFALLEQEFAVADVRAAVAGAVLPRPDPDLDPHRWLLDLGLAPDGSQRLVTTNFDLLFEAADAAAVPTAHPFLPDPRRAGALKGIVHLHGMVTPDYASAAPGGFVLSAADFGQAYLSDGWAAAFMRGLIDRYKVVFVGYSADDPPIQYLLEALNRTVPPDRLYAFHLGQAEQAAAIWRHKGVTAIPFAGYDQLWRSIELWAARARNPAEWRASVASSSLRGPRGLERHERGQVAHLVSTDIGARAFAEGGVIPPAEWLCVFDPAVRRAKDRDNGSWASPAVEHPDDFYDPRRRLDVGLPRRRADAGSAALVGPGSAAVRGGLRATELVEQPARASRNTAGGTPAAAAAPVGLGLPRCR